MEPVPVPLYVESGVHLLADLIAKQRQGASDMEISPLTSQFAFGQDPFKNDVFWMCPAHTEDGLTAAGTPNFEWLAPSGPDDNICVYWHKHAQRSAFMNRDVKGREWTHIMLQCLRSIS